MAGVQECREAIDRLAGRLAEVDPEHRRAHLMDRTVSCRVTDLDTMFRMRLHEAGLTDIRLAEPADAEPPAQVRISLRSDDLVALADERLDLARSWLTGRVKLEASLGDLLRLRRLL
ncbi:MAG: SCP-2 sterol transfer family protein [Streptosporangiales bacterium]|nr:SCP-2 sterol transfer family protein [Streptosporangiales bacterium]